MFWQEKRKEVLKQMEDSSIMILTAGPLVKETADETYAFSVNRNFYYLTHIDEADVVLVFVKGKEEKEILYIKKSDPAFEKWYAATITKEKAWEVSGVADIRYLDDLGEDLSRFVEENELVTVYIDDEEDPIIHFGMDIIDQYEVFDDMDVLNAYPIIAKLRASKDPYEIEKMKEAIHITNEGIHNILDHLQPGKKEYELEAYYNFVLNNHQVPRSFTTIAAAGKNGTILHYSTNNQEVKDGDLILFDLGVAKERWCSDISRTFPANGKFTERQRQVYDIVLKTQQKVFDAVRPGISTKELNEVVFASYQEELKKIGLIKEGSREEVLNYYWHGVSHPIGLDVHDVGIARDEPLPVGAVISNEPGLYIAEWDIGVRIEDDVLVTEHGGEWLSSEILKDPDEIEAYMANRK